MMLFLALLSSYCLLVSAITIDEGQIILREPPSNHTDEEYDLFGYSAALHLTQTPASLNNARFVDIERAKVTISVYTSFLTVPIFNDMIKPCY